MKKSKETKDSKWRAEKKVKEEESKKFERECKRNSQKEQDRKRVRIYVGGERERESKLNMVEKYKEKREKNVEKSQVKSLEFESVKLNCVLQLKILQSIFRLFPSHSSCLKFPSLNKILPLDSFGFILSSHNNHCHSIDC